MNVPPPAAPAPDLAALLVQRGCDARAIERGRRVAAESGQRLESVLLQLGLVGERDIAAAFAELLGVAGGAAGALSRHACRAAPPRSRRASCAAPAPCRWRSSTACWWWRWPTRSTAFAADAIAAATGLPVRVEVAVPIELEAALDRLFPAEATPPTPADGDDGGDPLEEDAERLKDLASEAPVIRLVNQIIARAVETRASRHPYRAVRGRAARPLPLRRRAARGGKPAAAPGRGDHLAHQDHGAARHRRAAAAAGRPHPAGGARPGRRFPRLHRRLDVRRDGGAARARPQRRGVRLRPARPAGAGGGAAVGRRCSCPTASCWSPARPAAARPPRSTPACCRSIR